MSRGLSTELYATVAITALKQMVVKFQFTGHGVDDLVSGYQPFLVSYGGSAHRYNVTWGRWSYVSVSALVSRLIRRKHTPLQRSGCHQCGYHTIPRSTESRPMWLPHNTREGEAQVSERHIQSVYHSNQVCGAQSVPVPRPWLTSTLSESDEDNGCCFQNGAPFITERSHALSR